MQIKYLSTSNWQLSAHAPLQSRDAIVVMPFIRPAQAETALRLMAERAQVPGVLLGSTMTQDGVLLKSLIRPFVSHKAHILAMSLKMRLRAAAGWL